MKKISNFDDWIDYFESGKKISAMTPPFSGNYQFETKLGRIARGGNRVWRFSGSAEMATVGLRSRTSRFAMPS